LSRPERVHVHGLSAPVEPEDTAQRNFTDPESRIMPSSSENGSFIQGYNCQAAVDSHELIIVAADVTQQTNDSRQAEPMLEQVKANAGKVPTMASLDAGYFSGENVEELGKLGTEAFIATGRRKHGKVAPPAPSGQIKRARGFRQFLLRGMRTRTGPVTPPVDYSDALLGAAGGLGHRAGRTSGWRWPPGCR
jgi:Transposase DDE domain